MLYCDKSEAQAISSENGDYFWHENSLLPIKTKKLDIIELEEIDVYEYNQYKMLNGKTPEEIIDAYTLSLIEGGLL